MDMDCFDLLFMELLKRVYLSLKMDFRSKSKIYIFIRTL